MSTERKVLVTVFAVAALLILAIWLWPRVEAELAPDLVTAWVAVEVDGEGVARTGRFVLEADTPFTLHAVLEARQRDGTPLYYTAARAVELAGREIDAARIRRWDRPRTARVLWFTLEGETPYLHLDPERGIEALRFQALFRPEWPTDWSIRGAVGSRYDEHLDRVTAHRRRAFGTQRYQVRIEIEDPGGPAVAPAVIPSWGPEDIVERVDEMTTVTVELPGVLAPASRTFGLTQVDIPPGASEELRRRIVEWADERLLLTRATVLRDHLAAADTTFEDLEWREIRMGEPRWGHGIFAGDLLRVADTFVILLRGREPGAALALDDLAFDFSNGPVIAPLGQTFGERRRLDHARLATAE